MKTQNIANTNVGILWVGFGVTTNNITNSKILVKKGNSQYRRIYLSLW